MLSKTKMYIAFFLYLLILKSNVYADERFYVWTYEYKTVERGKAEFENYFTLSSLDKNKMKGNTTAEHIYELEVGMTERFDFSVYQVFNQKPGSTLKYDKFKLRMRYKIGEKNQYFMDPLIYFEYINKPDFSEHTVEAKLILAKDLGKFNIAINPVFEFENKEKWEFVPKYAVGMSYGVTDLLRVGIEAKGSKDGHYVGPVISHGVEHLWVALGSAINVNEVKTGKPELQFRMILGIVL